MSQLPLMIFAAGFGTRMGTLTQDRPKPLIAVGGRALIDHALYVARGAGAAKIVINLHYLGEKIAAHLAGQNVEFAWERPQVLETGGGLRAALPRLGAGPVMLLNSDAVWTGQNPLTQLIAAWDSAKMDALLLLTPPEQAHGHTGAGDFLLDNVAASPAQKATKAPIYLGAQILNPALLHDIPETVFSLGKLWDKAIDTGRAYGMMHQGGWCDVGTPEGIAVAEKVLNVHP
ncbi:MAG: nucleotidyltransferase family protein [Cypionkella sp.]|nr:nucleotidyltransferase family protein [Cypionkella sp.]